jgi:hypothetical protein
MNFTAISKNNIGAIATIILIILLSQGKFFNFLIDTLLGRAFLIFFILAISSINKFLGVIIVLFIIILFNQSDIGYMEGFTNDTKMMPSTNNNVNDINKTPEEKKNKPEVASGREGFNIIDRESTILKGKRSNEVPIFSNTRSQTDDVEPSDKTVYSSSYSTF